MSLRPPGQVSWPNSALLIRDITSRISARCWIGHRCWNLLTPSNKHRAPGAQSSSHWGQNVITRLRTSPIHSANRSRHPVRDVSIPLNWRRLKGLCMLRAITWLMHQPDSHTVLRFFRPSVRPSVGRLYSTCLMTWPYLLLQKTRSNVSLYYLREWGKLASRTAAIWPSALILSCITPVCSGSTELKPKT